MMGQGNKYAIEARGFRRRLRAKLRIIREAIGDLAASCLHQVDLAAYAGAIETAYNSLADAGEDSLNADQSDQFRVGATKILHWIAPSLFIMVDANVATAFRAHHRVNYRNSTQPGYTAKKYLECLQRAQDEIHAYGFEHFVRIELTTPVARLFDKAAWIAGLSV
jgi:hypothetical protein